MPKVDTACPSKPLSRVAAPDVITCGYLVIIGLLATMFAERLPHWWWYPLTHALLILALGIFLLTIPPMPTGWALFIRWWYPAFLIPPIFSELQSLVHPINPGDIDAQLIAVDLALFGVHPILHTRLFFLQSERWMNQPFSDLRDGSPAAPSSAIQSAGQPAPPARRPGSKRRL